MDGKNFDEALYEVSKADSLQKLRRLRIPKTILRFLGYYMDGEHSNLLRGKARDRYYNIPENMRLTRRELNQGTITVSNLGSLYPDWKGNCTLLDIVPPQKVAIGIGSIHNGTVTLTIAFDHRILDTDDIIPFMKRLDELLKKPLAILEPSNSSF